MAYVSAISSCGVNSNVDCGEKTQTGRYIINICEFYWHDAIKPSSRVGTLVHESSHHFGTKDEGYCDQVDCLALSSREARNNADTYTKLVEELVADLSLSGGSSSASRPNGVPQPIRVPQQRRTCPQHSVSETPDQDGDCMCSTGYGCSQSGVQLDCPTRRDQFGRQWFQADCRTCKCYPVEVRQPQWRDPFRFY